MVRHRAVRDLAGERQAHEVFRRDVFDAERLAVAEAEAQVVGRVAYEQAAVCADLATMAIRVSMVFRCCC